MTTALDSLRLRTEARDEIIDITEDVQRVVSGSRVREGVACVFVAGSTAAITTVEHEPGLVADLQGAMDRLYPKGDDYEPPATGHVAADSVHGARQQAQDQGGPCKGARGPIDGTNQLADSGGKHIIS
jgi:secondary thiamine-phosphate synthase enzyme